MVMAKKMKFCEKECSNMNLISHFNSNIEKNEDKITQTLLCLRDMNKQRNPQRIKRRVDSVIKRAIPMGKKERVCKQ